MVAHLFQNYDTIYLRLFPRILVYLRFYSQVYDYFLTNAHIYAHKKKPYTFTNKHVYVGSQKVVV